MGEAAELTQQSWEGDGHRKPWVLGWTRRRAFPGGHWGVWSPCVSCCVRGLGVWDIRVQLQRVSGLVGDPEGFLVILWWDSKLWGVTAMAPALGTSRVGHLWDAEKGACSTSDRTSSPPMVGLTEQGGETEPRIGGGIATSAVVVHARLRGVRRWDLITVE